MKTKILTILAIALSIASCEKNNNKSPLKDQGNFVFGYENAVCALCNSIHPSNMLFSLNNSNVFRLKDSLLFSGPISNLDDASNFSMNPVGGNSLQVATELQNGFPAFLLNNTDSAYGSPDASFGKLVFSVNANGTVRHWNINMDTTTLPFEIRPYVAHVIASLDTLYPPFRAMDQK